MKKILLVFTCLIVAKNSDAQSWNLALNAISGNPNFGTSSNHPINFFTNGTQRMTLSTTGALRINTLAGTGSRFIQADANGNLVAWTGSMVNANYVLFGDGSWKLPPVMGDAGVFYTPVSSKLGVGMSTPVTALDVSGDVSATGFVKAPGGFMFSSTDGFAYNSTDNYYTVGKLPGVSLPAFSWCGSVNSISNWLLNGQGGFISAQDYQAAGSTAATNVKASLAMFIRPSDGSGYIDVDGKDNNNTINNALNINYFCGRNTNINTGTNGGNVNIATGSSTSKLIAGDFVSMRKHVEIGDPTTGITNAATNTALDINVNSGSGLRFQTITNTLPLILVENNSNSLLKQEFKVYGDGHTEINTENLDALVIKDANLSNNTSFKVYSYGTAEISTGSADALIIKNGSGGSKTFGVKPDGKTYIGNSVGIGTQPSTNTFLNIDAGSNALNADLFKIATASVPNALKIDSKGVVTIDGIASTSYLFKVKNQGNDLFAVKHDGTAYAREVIVTPGAFPDYVFSKDYNLLKLKDVKEFINKNHRLPHMPSAEEVEKNGASLGEIQRITVEKVEELYLYIIQLEEKVELLNKQIKLTESK